MKLSYRERNALGTKDGTAHLLSPMLEFSRDILRRAEEAAANGLDAALAALRQLGLDDFGQLMISMPNSEYPALSSVLPAMASAEVQKSWTGASGLDLLRASLAFVRVAEVTFCRVARRPLRNASMLDFGCGYGRLIRLMYYYSDPSRLSGCDPWDRSIALCHEARLTCRLDQTDYLPESLPYSDASFDFVYAFSVFTHTSGRATRMALNVLRKVLRPGGVLAITLRPIEYWDFALDIPEPAKRELESAHRRSGFAFRPHASGAVEPTYGDTSMTVEFLVKEYPGWSVASVDRSIEDPYQIRVFLIPAEMDPDPKRL
jgi:SAM-dependent methyltransferase